MQPLRCPVHHPCLPWQLQGPWRPHTQALAKPLLGKQPRSLPFQKASSWNHKFEEVRSNYIKKKSALSLSQCLPQNPGEGTVPFPAASPVQPHDRGAGTRPWPGRWAEPSAGFSVLVLTAPPSRSGWDDPPRAESDLLREAGVQAGVPGEGDIC